MADLHFHVDGRTLPLVVKRAAVRRMNLRVDARGGAVRLTVPPFVPLRAAIRWVEEKRGWVEDQMARLPPACPIVPGMMVRLAGEDHRLDWAPQHPRTVRCSEGVIRIGGPIEGLGPRLIRWLKREALDRLTAETRRLAGDAGLTVTKVGVGDPTSRWGSCSSSGLIRYSWRLILAPEFVLKATVAHEVAHLVHMDHSPRFYATLAELLGDDPRPARQWLRAHGPSLHQFGRGI